MVLLWLLSYECGVHDRGLKISRDHVIHREGLHFTKVVERDEESANNVINSFDCSACRVMVVLVGK